MAAYRIVHRQWRTVLILDPATKNAPSTEHSVLFSSSTQQWMRSTRGDIAAILRGMRQQPERFEITRVKVGPC